MSDNEIPVGFDARFEPIEVESPPPPWPELDALPADVEQPADPYPVDGLGPILSRAATAIARDVQAPVAMAAASVLATAGLSVQPLVNVMLPHGQSVPTSLYLVTAADSGDRKSRVDALAAAQVDKVTQQQAREYAVAKRKHLERIAELRAEKKGSKDREPAPLRLRR